MSMWAASDETFTSPPDRLATPAGAVAAVVCVALLVGQARIRTSEAWASAALLRISHLRPAASMGDSVVFPLDGRWVGFSLSVACSAALLLAPFFAFGGFLILTRRVSSRRAAIALAATTAVVVMVNQARLFVIVGSMLAWGFERGYERSHIFLGTVLSTVGVIIGIFIFVWMLVSSPRQRPIVHK